jgi:hypothetical protein
MGNPAQIQGTSMTREKVEQLWVGNEQRAARPATDEEILKAARADTPWT